MKRHFHLLISLASFLILVQTNAQTAWERISTTPQENSINDLTLIPGTNKVIGVCDGATIMTTEDTGETWQILCNPAGIPNHYHLNTVYFFDSSLGFIGGQNYSTSQYYMLKTTDGGLNWQLLTNFPATPIYDFYFVDQNTGFAAGYNNLLKTTDAGESWNIVETGATFKKESIDFCNDSTGFIVGSSYESMLITTDYGNTWQVVPLNSPLTNGEISKIQFVNNNIGYIAQDFGDILKTTNAGTSWETVFSDEFINAYAMDFYDEEHGVAAGYQDYFQSCIISTNDGGTTWSVFTLPVFQENDYSVCAINNSDYIFSGILGTIYRTENSGESWNAHSERDIWGDVIQVQHFEDNIIYSLAFYNLWSLDKTRILYKSTDGGENFTSIAELMVVDPINFSGVAIHFINPDQGFLAYYNNTDLLTVLKTGDGGNEWVEIQTGNYDHCPYAIKFYDTQNGLIVSQGVILKTADGGETWQEVYYDYYYLLDMEYINANDIIVSGGGYNTSKIIFSHDSGYSWDALTLGNYGSIYDIEIINNSIFLACSENVILKSSDLGETWQFTQVINDHDIEFHAIDFPSETIGYAVGSGTHETMVKTTDSGNTWHVLTTGSTSGLNAVHFLDENTGFVYGENGLILKTTNGGTTFIHENPSIKSGNHFTVFPNPFHESITVDGHLPAGEYSINIELISLTGEKIAEREIRTAPSTIGIYGENINPGIYLISIKMNNKILETQKIIKR
jgi:photosystem II stability/assembly factor-like uncharacterized protein